MREHFLSFNSSQMDIINVLNHLRTDADDAATPHAMAYTRTSDLGDKAKAMYLLGQKDLLTYLLWALDGTAEKEGCEPTVLISMPD